MSQDNLSPSLFPLLCPLYKIGAPSRAHYKKNGNKIFNKYKKSTPGNKMGAPGGPIVSTKRVPLRAHFNK